jgi:hypothetical protein
MVSGAAISTEWMLDATSFPVEPDFGVPSWPSMAARTPWRSRIRQILAVVVVRVDVAVAVVVDAVGTGTGFFL